MIPVNELRGTESGPVALLGNGPSLANTDLVAVAKAMPLFGINSSWELAETRWRCYVDRPHHEAIARGQVPAPKIAFHPQGLIPRKTYLPPMPCDTVAVRWLPKLEDFRPPTPFRGLDLAGGSYCHFAGFFALEIVAMWNESFCAARGVLDYAGVEVIQCHARLEDNGVPVRALDNECTKGVRIMYMNPTAGWRR